MKLFSKHNVLLHAAYMPIKDWAVSCTSNLKEIVSHSSKGSLMFHVTASITLIVSNLVPSSHQHQPEDDYCLPEEVQKRGDESNSGTYQDLNLDTMDYTFFFFFFITILHICTDTIIANC